MPQPQFQFQKVKQELTRLRDFDALKKEVTRLSQELRSFTNRQTEELSTTAKKQFQRHERRFNDFLKQVQKAQKQVDQEFGKVWSTLGQFRKEAEKSLKEIKKKTGTKTASSKRKTKRKASTSPNRKKATKKTAKKTAKKSASKAK